MDVMTGTDVEERSGPARPAVPSPGRTESLRARGRRTARTYGPALALYGAVKLIGFAVFMQLLEWSGEYLGKNPRFGGGTHPWDVLGGWDGWWYQQVAQNGYQPRLVPLVGQVWSYDQNSAAFFPLYPGLMRIVANCTGLGLYGAGMLVSVLASFAAAAGIYAVTARLTDRRTGVIAAAVWGVFPGSGAEWAVYSDSLFVALAAWACYFVLTRNWLAAGVTTFVAGLNRPTAAALVAAVGIAALLALYRRRDGVLGPLAAGAIAPVGMFGYIAWVGWQMGDLGGYFKLQRGAWLHFFDSGAHTRDVFEGVLFGHNNYLFAYPTEDLIAVLLVLTLPVLLTLLVRQRPPAFLLVYTVVTIVLVLGSQQIFGNTSRYLLPAFPLFVPVAVALRRLSRTSLAVVLGTAAVASGWYAGYVLFELGIP
ncbi:hypothetical protein [Kitasatospora sp. NPDC088346]|uniref:hypothetical protein n=1 Tax=Kitasatospora sp. NPDC088346 TaxID=3364073 RepID=UPI0037F58459